MLERKIIQIINNAINTGSSLKWQGVCTDDFNQIIIFNLNM